MSLRSKTAYVHDLAKSERWLLRRAGYLTTTEVFVSKESIAVRLPKLTETLADVQATITAAEATAKLAPRPIHLVRGRGGKPAMMIGPIIDGPYNPTADDSWLKVYLSRGPAKVRSQMPYGTGATREAGLNPTLASDGEKTARKKLQALEYALGRPMRDFKHAQTANTVDSTTPMAPWDLTAFESMWLEQCFGQGIILGGYSTRTGDGGYNPVHYYRFALETRGGVWPAGFLGGRENFYAGTEYNNENWRFHTLRDIKIGTAAEKGVNTINPEKHLPTYLVSRLWNPGLIAGHVAIMPPPYHLMGPSDPGGVKSYYPDVNIACLRPKDSAMLGCEATALNDFKTVAAKFGLLEPTEILFPFPFGAVSSVVGYCVGFAHESGVSIYEFADEGVVFEGGYEDGGGDKDFVGKTRELKPTMISNELTGAKYKALLAAVGNNAQDKSMIDEKLTGIEDELIVRVVYHPAGVPLGSIRPEETAFYVDMQRAGMDPDAIEFISSDNVDETKATVTTYGSMRGMAELAIKDKKIHYVVNFLKDGAALSTEGRAITFTKTGADIMITDTASGDLVDSATAMMRIRVGAVVTYVGVTASEVAQTVYGMPTWDSLLGLGEESPASYCLDENMNSCAGTYSDTNEDELARTYPLVFGTKRDSAAMPVAATLFGASTRQLKLKGTT